MKYERSNRARNDYSRLSESNKKSFKEAVALLNDAYERRGEQIIPAWPKQLRVKDVAGAKGVWEMTWEWPNGRATFEYLDLGDNQMGIRWRRIGSHEIFRDP